MSVFEYVVRELANERPLAEKYRDHALTGNYIGFRECHLAPDWLLIYSIVADCKTLKKRNRALENDLWRLG